MPQPLGSHTALAKILNSVQYPWRSEFQPPLLLLQGPKQPLDWVTNTKKN